MRNRLMGMSILLTAALASSAVAFAQNGQRASKPFDPHDLSGFWDITNIGVPRGALNETSNNRPQMTQWGLEQFRKTKTGDANALTNGAYPNQKDWNDPIQWCDPSQALSIFERRAWVSVIATECDERRQGIAIVRMPRQALLENRYGIANARG